MSCSKPDVVGGEGEALLSELRAVDADDPRSRAVLITPALRPWRLQLRDDRQSASSSASSVVLARRFPRACCSMIRNMACRRCSMPMASCACRWWSGDRRRRLGDHRGPRRPRSRCRGRWNVSITNRLPGRIEQILPLEPPYVRLPSISPTRLHALVTLDRSSGWRWSRICPPGDDPERRDRTPRGSAFELPRPRPLARF